MTRRFIVVEDEGSFFASWSILDRGLDGKGVMAYDITSHPEVMPPALVKEWVKELKIYGKVTPVELRVTLDLLVFYADKGITQNRGAIMPEEKKNWKDTFALLSARLSEAKARLMVMHKSAVDMKMTETATELEKILKLLD